MLVSHQTLATVLFSLSLIPAISFAAAPWQSCGKLSQMSITGRGAISGKPLTQYEYGIAFNSSEPVPVITTTWNYGVIIYNKIPYFVESDNPINGMKMGGFMFYSGTRASDDNCGAGNFRHSYWYQGSDNGVVRDWSGGCFGGTAVGADLTVYCRLR